jgi:hypothetical protein
MKFKESDIVLIGDLSSNNQHIPNSLSNSFGIVRGFSNAGNPDVLSKDGKTWYISENHLTLIRPEDKVKAKIVNLIDNKIGVYEDREGEICIINGYNSAFEDSILITTKENVSLAVTLKHLEPIIESKEFTLDDFKVGNKIIMPYAQDCEGGEYYHGGRCHGGEEGEIIHIYDNKDCIVQLKSNSYVMLLSELLPKPKPNIKIEDLKIDDRILTVDDNLHELELEPLTEDTNLLLAAASLL